MNDAKNFSYIDRTDDFLLCNQCGLNCFSNFPKIQNGSWKVQLKLINQRKPNMLNPIIFVLVIFLNGKYTARV